MWALLANIAYSALSNWYHNNCTANGFLLSYLVALSLEQEQGQAAGSDVWTDADVATLSEYVS